MVWRWNLRSIVDWETEIQERASREGDFELDHVLNELRDARLQILNLREALFPLALVGRELRVGFSVDDKLNIWSNRDPLNVIRLSYLDAIHADDVIRETQEDSDD